MLPFHQFYMNINYYFWMQICKSFLKVIIGSKTKNKALRYTLKSLKYGKMVFSICSLKN